MTMEGGSMSRSSLLAWVLALMFVSLFVVAPLMGVPVWDFIGFMVFGENQPVAEVPPTLPPITATLPPTYTPWPSSTPTRTETASPTPTATEVPLPDFFIMASGTLSSTYEGVKCPDTGTQDFPHEVPEGYILEYIENFRCTVLFARPESPVLPGQKAIGYVRIYEQGSEAALEILTPGITQLEKANGVLYITFEGEIDEDLAGRFNTVFVTPAP